jgi:hypothetical protein
MADQTKNIGMSVEEEPLEQIAIVTQMVASMLGPSSPDLVDEIAKGLKAKKVREAKAERQRARRANLSMDTKEAIREKDKLQHQEQREGLSMNTKEAIREVNKLQHQEQRANLPMETKEAIRETDKLQHQEKRSTEPAIVTQETNEASKASKKAAAATLTDAERQEKTDAKTRQSDEQRSLLTPAEMDERQDHKNEAARLRREEREDRFQHLLDTTTWEDKTQCPPVFLMANFDRCRDPNIARALFWHNAGYNRIPNADKIHELMEILHPRLRTPKEWIAECTRRTAQYNASLLKKFNEKIAAERAVGIYQLADDDSCYDPDTGALLDDSDLQSPRITQLMDAMMNTQCGLEIPEGWTEVTATKKYYAKKGTAEKVWRLDVPSPDWIESVSTLRYYTTPDGGVGTVWDLASCAVDWLLLMITDPAENWEWGISLLPGSKLYINHQERDFRFRRPIDHDLYDEASKSLLPPGWEMKGLAAKMYYNESTHRTIALQDDSDPQSAPLHPSADTSLPPGWTVLETHQMAGFPYYRNVSENKQELDHPAIQLLPLLPGWEERTRVPYAVRHKTKEFIGCPNWFKVLMYAKRKPHVNYLYHRAQQIHNRGWRRRYDADAAASAAVDAKRAAATAAAAAAAAADDDVDVEPVVDADREDDDGWEASVEDEEESNLAPFVMSKPPCWHIGK